MVKKLKTLAPGARQIVRNLMLLNDGTVLAGYRIGGSRWDFSGNDSKINTMDQQADVWGRLVGRTVHERVTTRPYKVKEWASRLDLRTPHPLPDVEGSGETWNKYLARQQRRIAMTGMDDKVVFRYFSVGTVKPRTDLRLHIVNYIAEGVAHESIKAVVAEEKRVADIVTGWAARRMSEREQGWLRARSLAPGIQPEPPAVAAFEGWDEFAMPMFGDNIRWQETPFGRVVNVHAWQQGHRIERAVQVLTCARLEDLRYPENGLEPWQAYAERAVDADGRPFGVEWSIVGELLSGEEVSSSAELELRQAMYLQKDYADHEEPAPEAVERGILVAKSTRDQVTTGQATQAGRFRGTLNVIISGEAIIDERGRTLKTAEEVVEERAAAFTHLYGGNSMRMQFTPPLNQSQKLTECIVGEPRDLIGYQRQIRFPYLAAGLPAVSNSVGDGAGPYIGHTRGPSRKPVFHDSHFATEGRGALGRTQNMYAIAGTLGSGKSVIIGAIGYNNARRGTRTIISDPSGPLMALCEMPELKPYSEAIDLLKGKPGILSPPSLIREPLASEFDEQGEWSNAVAQAKAERRDLVVDIARRSVGADLYENPRTLSVLRDAARTHDWYMTSSLWNLIDALEKMDDNFAHIVSSALVDASTAPVLSLLFPPRGSLFVQRNDSDKVLTVISTPGIRRAPDGIPRQDWNPQEMAADVILRLVALYTDRLIYSKPREQRAVIFLDEAEELSDFGPGRGFLLRLGRDHSKWNIGVYLGLKSISQALSGELRNFLAGAFVGRMANKESAVDMLDILNITDKSYARTLMRLSEVNPGEFIYADALGAIAGIKIDVDYHPELKNALLTNPTPEGSEAWNFEEVL